MKFIKNKKAFTLIELLVVVAVIGILVLLGAPRFIGYTQRAEDARIQHDIKVMEQEVGTVLIKGDDVFNKWEDNIKDLNQLAQDNELFEKEGDVKPEEFNIDETYKIIPEKYKDKINTKLKGTFYANGDGKVYYEHGKGPGYSDEEIDDLIKNHNFIPIADADELNNVRKDEKLTYGKGTEWEDEYTGGLGKQYVQVANIDLSEYSVDGWNPIGFNYSSRFTGTYDGGNYIITNLVVKGEGENYQGLFGYAYGATIRNVGLIDNKVTGRNNVGGLVGYAESYTKISNSYSTGSVTGTNEVGGLVGFTNSRTTIIDSYATGSVKGTNQVGGLVGWASNNVEISNSYSTGSVEGTIRVGGLVGQAYGGSPTIKNSHATGSVTGSGKQVGGLVGIADSSIENSYATGSVKGTNEVGGLVGYFYNRSISNSYATGSVEGEDEEVGGLVGRVDSNMTISNSYWNTETTKQPESARGTAKTTDEMKKEASYEGWNFTNIWEITPGNYPTLR